jgi:hypothetical protein
MLLNASSWPSIKVFGFVHDHDLLGKLLPCVHLKLCSRYQKTREAHVIHEGHFELLYDTTIFSSAVI